MYDKIEDVPEILTDFYKVDDEGVVVSAPKGEAKYLSDVERVTSLGKKISVVDNFIGMMLSTLQWDWFDEYQAYSWKLEEVTYFNEEALKNPLSVDEDGQPVYETPQQIPVEPIRPLVQTVAEFKTTNSTMFNKYNKKVGVSIGGQVISLNKDNADGLVSIKVGYDMIGDAVFPTNFIADTSNGTTIIPLETFEDFTAFALEFLQARGNFFKA